jgi:hypothetical protein
MNREKFAKSQRRRSFQGLEGSQTSPRRLKLREARSGTPLYPDASGRSLSDVALISAVRQFHYRLPPISCFMRKRPRSRTSVDSNRQLYRMAASGSRESPSLMFLSIASVSKVPDQRQTDRTAQSGAVPGSRLLPSDRTAALQSGSPPGRGRSDAVFLKRTKDPTS